MLCDRKGLNDMTIYKLCTNGGVIGYYTSKKVLLSAIRKHASELKLDKSADFHELCEDFLCGYRCSSLYIADFFCNGWIEEIPANQELE